MSIIVSKFGGSSTANAGMFYRLRRIIAEHPDRRYIILSAPGTDAVHRNKITNLLYQCYDQYIESGNMAEPLVEIKQRFSELSKALSLPDISLFAEAEIKRSAANSADHIASRGEYLCALIFSRWTGIPMVDAADIIHFKSNGVLDEKKTRSAIKRMAEHYPRAIIPGFYGAFGNGSIHTFPRNGSDISGALVAAGVNADVYENWSDVDGFMSADPSIVENAHFIPRVSYRQMRILSQEGAQILHPDCLSSVSDRNIPTLLKNTLNPDAPGTLISGDFTGRVFCVTGKDDYLYCRSDDPGITHLPENMPLRCLTDSAGREFVLVRRSECTGAHACLSPIACICAFGISDNSARRIVESIRPLHYFAEPDHFKILVPAEEYRDALKRVHAIAVDSDP